MIQGDWEESGKRDNICPGWRIFKAHTQNKNQLNFLLYFNLDQKQNKFQLIQSIQRLFVKEFDAKHNMIIYEWFISIWWMEWMIVVVVVDDSQMMKHYIYVWLNWMHFNFTW